MGRNGTKPPVFPEMLKFINSNTGKVVTSQEILLGKEPGRNAETAYLYKFVKLGHILPVENSVKNKNAKFKIVKRFPENYNSIDLGKELKLLNT